MRRWRPFLLPLSQVWGVSEKAFVSESAVLGTDVSVYPLAYVGGNALIGDHAVLFPGVFVGRGPE